MAFVVEAKDKGTNCYYSIRAFNRGGSGHKVHCGRFLDSLKITSTAQEAAEIATASLNPKTIKAGKYDIIFDVIGKSSFSNFAGSLNKNGIYLLANPKMSMINREKRVAKKSGIKYISGNMDKTKDRIEQLNFLKGLIEDDKLKSVIERRYPLEQTANAHEYIEKGEKTGNVVITVVDNNKT